MHRMVKIEHSVAARAWTNWYNFHYGLHCEELETRFFDFIHPNRKDSFIDDCIDWDNDTEEYYYILPHTANHLVMAASPHAYAVFKAWYANHPWK